MKQINLEFKPFQIQYDALGYLFDKKHTEIFFGGAARVSKTYLAVAFVTIEALRYPGIHIGVGRSRLSYLKKTTFVTLMEFFDHQGIEENIHYKYNGMDNILTFNNGSKLFFLELYDNPSDANFDRLGSLSLTHCVIDEASQISKTAYDTLAGRISYKLHEYSIKGKMLIVSNPTQGWLKERFYIPYKEDTLEDHQAVILGLPTDNPTAGQEYVDRNLKIMGEAAAQRYLYGNWDYADEDHSVFKFSDLVNCFKDVEPSKDIFISADLADGGDRTVIIVWRGLKMIDVYCEKSKLDVGEKKIREFINIYNVRVQNVVVDADGLGTGVWRHLKGVYGFKGGSSSVPRGDYFNLKTQSIMKLKELVEDHEIEFMEKYRDIILKEFQAIKYENADKGMLRIEGKDKMKKILGSSPDFFDAIMMRMVFNVKKSFALAIG